MWLSLQQQLQTQPSRVFLPAVVEQTQSYEFYQKLFAYSTVSNNRLWKHLCEQKAQLWSLEMLLKFGVNNNFVIFQTPIITNTLAYRQFLVTEFTNKSFNKKTHREMTFGFTTGRCGFVRNQKRTYLATDITVRTALWFCKRIYKFLRRVKIRFLGQSRNVKRYLENFGRFELGNRRVQVHSLIDVTPVPYNGTRQKMRGRKRYRFHKYTYRRFRKMTKVKLPKRQRLAKNALPF